MSMVRPIMPSLSRILIPPTLGILGLLGSGGSTEAQEGPVPVTVSEIVEREVNQGRSFVGTVLPARRSTVGSPVEETVIAFPVTDGEAVKEGDVLAELRSKIVELELAAARAERDARKAELEELENGSRPEEIARAKANVARTDALRRYALARNRRVEDLFRSRSASPEELEEALSNAEAAEQAYQEAKAELDLLIEGPRVEQIEQTRARLAMQEEMVKQLELRLSMHTITAPFDGFITAEHTETGQWASRGDPIVELIELDVVELEVNVLEDYVAKLEKGTEARVAVEALPNRTFTGEIAMIVPQADLRSRSFPVKIRIENSLLEDGTPLLKSGMLARATLPVGGERRALLVHKDAVVLGGSSPAVYVIDRDSAGESETGTARPVEVRLGVAAESMIEVIGDLQAGELVAVFGNERLRPGQEVRILEVIPPDQPAADPQADRTARRNE